MSKNEASTPINKAFESSAALGTLFWNEEIWLVYSNK